jgi:hypothetical protein
LTLLHGLTYEEYLKTTWWRARREAVLRYRGEREMVSDTIRIPGPVVASIVRLAEAKE